MDVKIRKVQNMSDGSKKADAGTKTSNGRWNSSPDRPCHIAEDSLLCSSNTLTNYRGFFTFSMILLVLSNLRVALENFIKYGLLINHKKILLDYVAHVNTFPVILVLLVSHLFIWTAFITEKLSLKNILSNRMVFMITFVNTSTILFFPAIIILASDINPLVASFCLMCYAILYLKLISYAHVNYWCRCDYFLKAKGGVTDFAPNANSSSHKSYPANLTIFNLYYFILAPTLCYELNYPRTKKIRKTFLLKRFLEVLFLPQVVFALCQQWIYPLMMNAVEPLKMMDYSRMLERMLKLAVPNIIICIFGKVGIYQFTDGVSVICIFHCCHVAIQNLSLIFWHACSNSVERFDDSCAKIPSNMGKFSCLAINYSRTTFDYTYVLSRLFC
ncbi:Diacylglycerol O-acyltransferase [Trichinella spiralis]|uniref:diacylglycerol O-acyltransferase n=1 Tax=Trichinella spiralis TaxID=6334 RepID=A0ABR3KIN4_TRISP